MIENNKDAVKITKASIDSAYKSSVGSDSAPEMHLSEDNQELNEETKGGQPEVEIEKEEDTIVIMPNSFIPLVRNPKFEFVPYQHVPI